MSRTIVIALAVSALAGGIAAAAQVAPPRLGRAATPDEVAKVDIAIPPDGKGLPAGSGTVAQGAEVYAQKCVVCHGPNGAGTPSGDRLSGGVGSLATGTYDQDREQLLAVCDDSVRLHPPRDADHQSAIALER